MQEEGSANMYGGLTAASPDDVAPPMFEGAHRNSGKTEERGLLALLTDSSQAPKDQFAQILRPQPCLLSLTFLHPRLISLGRMFARRVCAPLRVLNI